MAPRCRELKKFVKNPWAYYPLVDVVPRIRVAGHELKGLVDGGELLVSMRQSLAGRCLTLLHELFHIEHPEWPEDTVERMAIELYYHLTDKERLILALVLETRERERHQFFFSYEEERQDWLVGRADKATAPSRKPKQKRIYCRK